MNSTTAKNNEDQISISDAKELLAQTQAMKRTLKQLSKNQLIQLLLEQVNLVIEQQNINQVLLEKMKESASDK